MRTVLAALIMLMASATAFAAVAAPGAGGAPGAGATPAPKSTVNDEIFMVSSSGDRNGQSIIGRVKEIDNQNKKIYVIVNTGTHEGPIGWPLERVKQIKYDVDGRRAELPAGDALARYRLALWLISVGLKDDAATDLEAVAGKPGVPAEAWKLLAAAQEAKGQFRQALESIRKYLAAKPDDAEALAALKRLEAKVKDLPPEQVANPNPDPNPNPNPNDPAKPPEPEKPKVLEGFEVREGWRTQPWGNPADVSLLKDDETGNQYLAIQMNGDGKEDKTAVGLRVNVAFVKASKLIFNCYNPDKEPLKLSVAFNTSAGYYESKYVWARKGWNEGLVIDLNADKGFKCKETGWAFDAPLKGKDQVTNLMFLVNENRKTTIYLDYIHPE